MIDVTNGHTKRASDISNERLDGPQTEQAADIETESNWRGTTRQTEIFSYFTCNVAPEF